MHRRTLMLSALSALAAAPLRAQARPRVLLAGATGRNGSVILAALKDSPFAVRAMSRHVPDTAKDGAVEWVEADVTKPETLGPALAGVSYVIDAVAARGKEGVDRPEMVDYIGTRNFAAAAKAAGVKRFVIITSSVSGMVDHPLNKIAGDVLIYKGKAEEALIASGVPYTIIGPSGMTDEPGGQREIKLIPRSEYKNGMTITRADTAAVAIAALTTPTAANVAFTIYNGDAPAKPAWTKAFAGLPPR